MDKQKQPTVDELAARVESLGQGIAEGLGSLRYETSPPVIRNNIAQGIKNSVSSVFFVEGAGIQDLQQGSIQDRLRAIKPEVYGFGGLVLGVFVLLTAISGDD